MTCRLLWSVLLAAFMLTPALSQDKPKPAEKPKTDKAKEKPKSNARWMKTDLGPTFASTFQNLPVKGRSGVAKGLAIRVGDKGEAGVLFDTDTLSYAAGWTGGFVDIGAGRDALLDNDKIGGEIVWGTPTGPGWAKAGDFTDPRKNKLGPLPKEWAKWRGHYISGDRVVLDYSVGTSQVLESPGLQTINDRPVFTRTISIGRALEPATLMAAGDNGVGRIIKGAHTRFAVIEPKQGAATVVAIHGEHDAVSLAASDKGIITASIAAGEKRGEFTLLIWKEEKIDVGNLDALHAAASKVAAAGPYELSKPGPRRWNEILTTAGKLADPKDAGKSAYVIDTITIPFQNPWNAIMHIGGFDFFKNGDAAVCTMEGDVWLVKGIDADLDTITWQRIATGMYHPLGLKIVDDKIYVAGRDQITRLHDLNGDGEIDYYENFNNDGQVTFNSHEFVTNLETDPQGNFYHIRCAGGSDHGGTLAKVSKDGSNYEVFATGFRNPDGMGVGPDGVVTAGDNQGDWVPSSRLDIVEPGKFYGHMGSAHLLGGDRKRTTYDGPLCWIPHPVDNSSGSQAWVPHDQWGLPKGQMLHMSYGTCRLFTVLQEKIEGVPGKPYQGGVVQFPLKFASGIHRARFSPHDGQLYVAGLKGWQTSGAFDGCLQRVRYIGGSAAGAGKVNMPVAMSVHANGLSLTFTDALDKETAQDAGSYQVQRWNYLWSGNYGSKDWSVADPKKQGRDTMPVKGAKLSEDGRTVFLQIDDMQPVMQMGVTYNLEGADKAAMKNTAYLTVHKVGAAK